MFAVIFIGGNLLLCIAGKTAISQKLEPAKNSCHTVVITRLKAREKTQV